MLKTTVVLCVVAVAFGAVVPKLHISERVNQAKTTWTAVNNDAKLHKLHLGTAKDARDVTRKEMALETKIVKATIPDTFDARTQWPQCVDVISNIRNQAQCGSCWAVAAASVFSDRKCIASNGAVQTSFSGLDTLSCCTGSCGSGCDGGYPNRAWSWLVKTGVVSGGSYTNRTGCRPYVWGDQNQYCSPDATSDCPTGECQQSCQSAYNTNTYTSDKHKAQTSYYVDQDIAQIQTHIMTDGALEAAFDVYNDFFHYSSGVYQKSPDAEYAGGHAVRVIGWGTEDGTPYWLVANSWGTDWGLQGWFKILRGQDECGIEEAMCAGTVDGSA